MDEAAEMKLINEQIQTNILLILHNMGFGPNLHQVLPRAHS